jgi:hypothetical protein
MCFYRDDYDWMASVTKQASVDSGPATNCDECGCAIAATEWRHTIYQQEHEQCQICEDDSADEYIDPADREADFSCTHDYGETFSYARCRGCDNLLKAIESREIAEGCPAHARRPSLCGLHDEILEHEQRREYGELAVAMFPELAEHKIVRLMMEPSTLREGPAT